MSKNADTAADNPLIGVAMKAHHETAMHMNRSAFACLQAAPDSVCGGIPTDAAHPVASSERDAVIEKQRFAACRNEQLATQLELRREILKLREALTESDDLIALHKIYRDSAEKRAAAERESTRAMRIQLSKMDVLNRALQAEASAMERVLHNPSSYLSGREAHPLAALQGKRVLYVGGAARIFFCDPVARGSLRWNDGARQRHGGLHRFAGRRVAGCGHAHVPCRLYRRRYREDVRVDL
ncbi:hypothetical protein [Paraburkholderia youngii]|uniref:hypothetical protein n=1 Tax=Paraburkholderia youngii TaxID=2782701 RepID=UPI003D2021C8